MNHPEQPGQARPYHGAVPYATGFVRAGIALGVLSAVGWLGGCSSDSPGGPIIPPEPTSSFLSVSAGGLKTCSLTASGKVYCWGLGPLGDGSTASSSVPVAVTGGLTFSAVTAGNFVSCGLTTTAAPYCWGSLEASSSSSAPAAVRGGHQFYAVTIGDGFGPGHACGLTASGAVYCWGNNRFGQLGDGTTSGDEVQNGWPVRTVPVAVAGGLSFAAVTAGLFHTCGLTTSGTAYCWGDNESGLLGTGSTASYSSVPVAVAGGLTFTSLSNRCGVTGSGAAYCWGPNGAGGLGDGSTTSSLVPVAVIGGLTFSSVTSAGHSCGLTTNGAAYCWGSNSDGQLGTGDANGPEKEACYQQTPCSTRPVPVAGGLRFAALSAGGQTTCGVTQGGTTYCWGDNRYGQLGNGTTINSSEPVQVVGLGAPPPVAFVTVSPESAAIVVDGTTHLSATTRDANGTLLVGRPISWTSGNGAVATVDANGLVMGVGTGSVSVIATSESRSDTAVITVGRITFGSVSAGRGYTCGLTTSGAAYCWGAIYGGPVAVSGGFSFSALATGEAHACGLTSAGAAYCWGYNGQGQLGDVSTTSSPVPVAVAGGVSFSALAAGLYHSCGLTSAGAVYCWGWNGLGALGNGSTTNSSIPVAVSGSFIFRALAAGGGFTCGLTSAGAVYCWGRNEDAELGVGTATGPETCRPDGVSVSCSTVPVAVTGGLNFNDIAAGGWHACGLTGVGAAYCWGPNDHGQLGDGSTTNSATPVAVSGGLSFSALATGMSRGHTCGRTSAGTAYCWGWNDYGQLGNASTTRSSTPVPVSGGLGFSGLVTSYGHTCGVTSAGAAYCWGWNASGQLGSGTTTNSNVPVKVVGQP
ncbi:MAG: Ig-like domain-containing protein [Gemmatimonadales bacterium]